MKITYSPFPGSKRRKRHTQLFQTFPNQGNYSLISRLEAPVPPNASEAQRARTSKQPDERRVTSSQEMDVERKHKRYRTATAFNSDGKSGLRERERKREREKERERERKEGRKEGRKNRKVQGVRKFIHTDTQFIVTSSLSLRSPACFGSSGGTNLLSECKPLQGLPCPQPPPNLLPHSRVFSKVESSCPKIGGFRFGSTPRPRPAPALATPRLLRVLERARGKKKRLTQTSAKTLIVWIIRYYRGIGLYLPRSSNEQK